MKQNGASEMIKNLRTKMEICMILVHKTQLWDAFTNLNILFENFAIKRGH